MSTTNGDQLRLETLDMTDARIGRPNQLCRTIKASPGVAERGGTIHVVPSQYFPDQGFATVVLSADELIRLLEHNPFSIICETDPEATTLPQICQRVPERDRRNKIRAAWADPMRTPDHKHETVEVAVFGAKVEQGHGIRLGADSLAVLTDAAGRLHAAIDEIKENDGVLLKQRGILWQVNLDLTGDLGRQIMTFLAHNRDAKRISPGTTVGVENLLLTQLQHQGHSAAPRKFAERLARTYVIRQLYESFPIPRSLTELYPWNYEGRVARSDQFQGSGRASYIATAIGSLGKVLDRTGLTPEQLPTILDFAFRAWYKNCRTAVNDAHRDAIDQHYRTKYRLSTTLAMKVIILVSVRAYLLSKRNEASFVNVCDRILQKHWEHHREEYLNPKMKKISMDRFWTESVYFSESSRFNSGEVNTATLLRQLNAAANEVCGPLGNGGTDQQKPATGQQTSLAAKLKATGRWPLGDGATGQQKPAKGRRRSKVA